MNKGMDKFTYFEILFLKQFSVDPNSESSQSFKIKIIDMINKSHITAEVKTEIEILIQKLMQMNENDYAALTKAYQL